MAACHGCQGRNPVSRNGLALCLPQPQLNGLQAFNSDLKADIRNVKTRQQSDPLAGFQF